MTVFGGGTVQANPVPGEVTNLRLSSDALGELTITWDAPSDAPADYRVAWARDDLSYLSWNGSDETHRGNSYPDGADTSLTLSGLTGGETYKVRMRSRYNPGTSDGRSGPWTDEATQRVRGDAPSAPTALSAEEATVKGQTSIALSWTAPSHDALTGYNDTTTETGNTYVYAVTALSLDGDSPRSATVSIITRGGGGTTTRDDPPPPPDDENTVIEPDDEEEELIAQRQSGSDEVILASTDTGAIDTTGFAAELNKGATHFTTGNNEHGYLLDDGRASFVFPAFASEDYYVDLVAPAFRPPDGSNPAYTHYGPYMLEIYDLGPTERQGQPEGYGIKASNICVNNRCYNDPRFPEFHDDSHATNETHEVSVGNNPLSKNLSQAVAFRADTTGTTAKFQVDRIGVFLHSMTGGSIPQAAVHEYAVGSLGTKLFDLEPLYNDDGHIDYFIAPRDGRALDRNSRYIIAFTESGGSNASYKLYATAMGSEDTQADSMWPIDNSGITYDSDLANPAWESMRSGDYMSNAIVTVQFRIYAGVAE